MINISFLVIILLLSSFISIEITVLLYSLYFIYSIFRYKRLSISKQLINSVAPLFFILAIGSTGLLQHDLILCIRDMQHLIIPIVGILFGYALYIRNHSSEQLVKSLILASVIVSSLLILSIFKNINQISIVSFKEWDTITTRVGMLAPIGLVSMVWVATSKNVLFKFQNLFFTIGVFVCLIAVVTSMSRMLNITTIIFFVIVMELHKKIPKFLKVLPIIIIIIQLVLLLVVNNNIKTPNNIILDRYIEKLLHPLEELSTPNTISMGSIGTNWRGYENYIASNQFYNNNIIEYLIGSGFGTGFDMGFLVIKNGIVIPTKLFLHNGYLYLLVKTGILGLLLYFIFITHNMKISSKKYHMSPLPFDKLISKFCLAILITGSIATFVTAGFVANGGYLLACVIIGFSNGPRSKIT